MSWLLLIVAGLLEVGWAIGLKYTEGFTRLWPSVGTALAMIVSLALLGIAMKSLPVGTAYAVWVGVGAVGHGDSRHRAVRRAGACAAALQCRTHRRGHRRAQARNALTSRSVFGTTAAAPVCRYVNYARRLSSFHMASHSAKA